MELIGRKVVAHEPDVALIPLADWHRSLRRGDDHCWGLAIATSKFTGIADMPSVLVVAKDDPATDLMELKGASYGYINTSCTSPYLPPALMLNRKNIDCKAFLDMRPVKGLAGADRRRDRGRGARHHGAGGRMAHQARQ